MSINRQKDKAAVVHTYSGILLSYNAFESVLMRWMNLESVIQNEVRKGKKNRTLMKIYGIQKDGTDEPICRAAMETQT